MLFMPDNLLLRTWGVRQGIFCLSIVTFHLVVVFSSFLNRMFHRVESFQGLIILSRVLIWGWWTTIFRRFELFPLAWSMITLIYLGLSFFAIPCFVFVLTFIGFYSRLGPFIFLAQPSSFSTLLFNTFTASTSAYCNYHRQYKTQFVPFWWFFQFLPA